MKEILYHGIPIDGRMPLFNAENRQAVRDDRKGQTRRPMDPQPVLVSDAWRWKNIAWGVGGAQISDEFIVDRCPYGKAGDVRCLCEPLMRGAGGLVYYRDVGPNHFLDPSCDAPVISLITGKPIPWRWKRDTLTSIHMPTEAARTIHKVTDIRVERVQEITPLDAICEGYPFGLPSAGNSDVYTDRMVVAWFRNLWDSIYAKPRPILQAKKIVAYKSYPWSEDTCDPRTMINGKPHHCHPNPWVWVNVFEKVV